MSHRIDIRLVGLPEFMQTMHYYCTRPWTSKKRESCSVCDDIKSHMYNLHGSAVCPKHKDKDGSYWGEEGYQY